MEIILHHEDVEGLLREALAARGTVVPAEFTMKLRTNNKKNTFRIVLSDLPDGRGRVPKARSN